MMETRRIKTLVKGDHRLSMNDFVFGRIMGAMAGTCKEDPAEGLEFGWGCCENGKVIVTETTDERYEAFTSLIESWYPGLCIFNYVE